MSTPDKELSQNQPSPIRQTGVLKWAAIGSLLMWLAQPPVGWFALAFLAPITWLIIARRPERLGRPGYLRLWLAGCLYWLLAVHWVRLPHPLTPIGWLFLSAYLGCYLPSFIWILRRAIHQHRMPIWIAAPVAWTGLELVQARLFGGFLMATPSYSQVEQHLLLLVTPWVGAYGVTFVVLFASALFGFSGLKPSQISSNLELAARSLAMVFLVFLAGYMTDDLAKSSAKLNAIASELKEQALTVAIIQGDTRATWDPDPDRNRNIMDRQVALTAQAIAQAESEERVLDLIIWPESMFRAPLETFDGSPTPPAGTNENLIRSSEHTQLWFESLANRFKTPLLVGVDRFDWQPDPDEPDALPKLDFYNSAALLDGEGQLVATYDKMHLVPFGEYIPLASGMPALYFLTPIGSGMASGAGPVALKLKIAAEQSVTLSPSICYETVVPRVIRRQVAELTDRGEAPDVMVNLTNDAWFWGSSELDMHLACARYRAAETGTPLIVAANGGLSAVIDATGKVLGQGPRMKEHVLIADVPLRQPGEATFYVRYGDLFAGSCCAACVVVAAGGLINLSRDGKRDRSDKESAA